MLERLPKLHNLTLRRGIYVDTLDLAQLSALTVEDSCVFFDPGAGFTGLRSLSIKDAALYGFFVPPCSDLLYLLLYECFFRTLTEVGCIRTGRNSQLTQLTMLTDLQLFVTMA